MMILTALQERREFRLPMSASPIMMRPFRTKMVAFHKVAITNTFGEFLAAHGLKQARIAETEKYAHVTFFFNGGVEEPNEGEDRILVKSPKVATYDLKPEMSAYRKSARSWLEPSSPRNTM